MQKLCIKLKVQVEGPLLPMQRMQVRRNNLRIKMVATRISSDRRRQVNNLRVVTKTEDEAGEGKIEVVLKVGAVVVAAEETTLEAVGVVVRSKPEVVKEVDEVSKITMDEAKDPRRPLQVLLTMLKEGAIKSHRKINNMVNKAVTTKNPSITNLPRFTSIKDTNHQGVDRITIAEMAPTHHFTTMSKTFTTIMERSRHRIRQPPSQRLNITTIEQTQGNSIHNSTHMDDTTMIDKDNSSRCQAAITTIAIQSHTMMSMARYRQHIMTKIQTIRLMNRPITLN